jgi:L-ascorbate metabolism protein UlaG (beta-lactamase superfamily)
MKSIAILVIIIAIGVVGFFALNNYIETEQQGDSSASDEQSDIVITPIGHATMVLEWNGATIYTDPVGGAEAFEGQPEPDIILITDIHGDHLSVDTLEVVVGPTTVLVVPQAVAELLPAVPGASVEPLASRVVVLNNGESAPQLDFTVTAIPMYNLPGSAEEERHTKGRGNGYLIEYDGTRVYIAGDTAATPEMRNLQDIDIAFVPMNLPFTMGVEEAADAVLDFKPTTVYPYHYRGQDGLADIGKFKELVNAGDSDITVVLLDWYPGL